uniref:Uncharacterized protein n=1 Tax=Romanomermis culicivorax TaxID=13658 RepID=A0A915KJP6_ROMCU
MAFTNETAAAELNRMLGDQQRTKSSDDVPSIPLQNGQSSSSDETHQQQQQTPQNSEISQTAS